MVEFQCSGCGLCCKKVGKAVKDARAVKPAQRDARTKAVAQFPYKTDASGACSRLDAEGKCTVYDTRPDVCRVDKSFELFGKGQSRERYYEGNAKLCNTWIAKAGLDESFLVKENYS